MNEADVLKARNIELKKEIEKLKASAVFSDIDAQKEKDYAESQIRFRTVFECSRLGNKIISSDLVILQVNPAMVAMLGYENKEDILGTTIMDYTPPEFQKDWKALQENLWESSSPSFSLETCLRRKDGVLINCQVTSILFQDGRKTLGYTIIEDITEQRKLRREKEDFIAVASHELKTPITTLRATLQLVNRIIEKETTLTDKIVKLSKSAELHSVKLGNLVVNLLDATKLEQGQLSLNKIKIKASELIEKCCTSVRLEDKYSIIKTGDLNLEVYADEEKIDQVLINLVNNAIKYAPQSKEIVIDIQQVVNEVKISVSDKGPGISPENLSKLFERYFRAHKNDGNSSGLGLGLYISSEIVKRHGGKIGAESELGKGSKFWFTIPGQVSGSY